MNRWIDDAAEYQKCLTLIASFLRKGVSLPAKITRDDVVVVGFADECEIRQSDIAYERLRRISTIMGELEFYFCWIDEPSNDNQEEPGNFPAFVFDSQLREGHSPSAPGDMGVSLVDRMRSLSDRETLTAFNEWVVTSSSGRWAIYGDRYNSEMCLFLSRDDVASSSIRVAFPDLVADAKRVPELLWEDTDTPAGQTFLAEFMKNYA